MRSREKPREGRERVVVRDEKRERERVSRREGKGGKERRQEDSEDFYMSGNVGKKR